MSLENLTGMVLFAKVVEFGSFTAAAKEVGQTKSALSRQITKLEDSLGVRLLNRTTRNLNLTDAGREFYEHARRISEDAEEAERKVARLQDEPRGILRLSIPVSFGLEYVSSLLPEFMERYPDVVLDLDVSDQKVNMMEDGFDAALRIGHLEDSSLIARKITSFAIQIVARPDYWDKYGRPSHPNELVHHNCFRYSNEGRPEIWNFRDEDGRPLRIRINGNLKAGNGEILLRAVEQGLGVVQNPEFIQPLVPLEEVLHQYRSESIGLYILYPHSRHIPTKLRVFIDYMVEKLACR